MKKIKETGIFPNHNSIVSYKYQRLPGPENIISESTGIPARQPEINISGGDTVLKTGKVILCTLQDAKGNFWFATNGG